MKQNHIFRFAAFALILMAALCLCLSAGAAGSGDCGENVHWELDDAGHLRIYGTGPMDQDYYRSTPWQSDVTSVTIEEGVTSIGDEAFRRYSNSLPLTSVSIASTVTSIGDRAFYDRRELETLTLPDNVGYIGTEAFQWCDVKLCAPIGSKAAFTICGIDRSFYPAGSALGMKYDLDGDTVTGLAVTSCDSQAVAVTVPDAVTRLESRAFEGCGKLRNVSLPDSVKEIGPSAFGECTALTGITLPAGLTVIRENTFSKSGLRSITLPAGITELEYGAFIRCASLTSVTLNNGLKTIGGSAFYGCAALKTLTLPSTVKSIGRYAFSNCGLTQLTIPTGVTALQDYTFYEDPALAKVVIPDSVVSFGEHLFDEAPKAVIYCSKGSPADLYAQANDVKTRLSGTYVPPASGGDVKAGSMGSITFSFDPSSGGGYWENPYAVSSDGTVLKITGFTVDDLNDRLTCTIRLEGVYPGTAFVRVYVRTGDGDVMVWQKVVLVSGKLPVYKVTVTVSDTVAGTAKAVPASGTAGTEVTLKATPKKGYAFKEWKILKGDVKIRDDKFVLGRESVKVKAVFEDISLARAKIAAVKDQVVTGKAVKPKLTVKLNGVTLKAGTDYTVTYKNNKAVGKATITVTGKGKYTGSQKVTFNIIPKAVSLSGLKAGQKSVTVKWKQGSGITGYEIQYGLKKTLKGAKTVTVSKMKTVSAVIDGLKTGKTYYVRVRTYKTVKGVTWYSAWSAVRSVTVK